MWGALSNPVRRALLDHLKPGPRTTGELVDTVPHLSRFAVMQHLGVLEQAGLVLVRREGRTRLNYLNPAPLQEVRERWLSGFAEQAGRQATALKRHVEQPPEQPGQSGQPEQPEQQERESRAMTARSVHVESELRIEAPPATVFKALCHEQHKWYPFTYGGDRVRDIVFEPRVGGQVYEDWGKGAGHHYGTVVHYDPPVALAISGRLARATVLENAFVLEADGDATIVRHGMTAFGDLSDDDVEGIRSHGSLSQFEAALRAWVERGESVR